MNKTPVLIIGAGPTGLMMASQLALYDIPFVIVDKDPGPTTQSRAIGIQARSMEIFSQMGIVGEFLKNGEPAKAINFVTKGTVRKRIPLGVFGQNLTAYPYLFMHEQSKTERNFIDFLKKNHKIIHWNTEVLSLQDEGNEIVAVLKDKDGKEEKITAQWLVGADGAHSIVRHTLNIPLAGKTYKQSLFVLDCLIESDLPKDELSVELSDTAFAAFFPMKNNRWRVVGELTPELSNKEDITFEDVNKDFAQRMQMKITLRDPSWISMYHSHHRCVSTFHKGNYFLLGDAAHIHSPVGAQGMNTGLQDAYNLAWKLAFVYKKFAKPELLDTLTAERLPFAKKLVKTTDKMFNLVASTNRFVTQFRLYFMPRFLKFIVDGQKFNGFIFRTISQIGINYRHGPLAQNASQGNFAKEVPMPGDRLPYILLEEEKGKQENLQKYITAGKFHLFYFSGNDADSPKLLQSAEQYPFIATKVISLSEGTKEVYKTLGIQERGFYLIRPDMYIAYRSLRGDPQHFEKYLKEFFNKNL